MRKMWKMWIGLATVVGVIACATLVPSGPGGMVVIEAQTLPYLLTVAWAAPVDGSAVTYNCYLDGVQVVTGVAATTCQMPVATAGQHTVGVTSVNVAFVPNESSQATLTFQLKAPTAPGVVKVK